MTRSVILAALAGILAAGAEVRAEILVRWTQDAVPAPASLGLSTIVMPAAETTAVRTAIGQGYRVYLEVDARAIGSLVLPPAGLGGVVVRGSVSPAALAALDRRVASGGGRVLVLDDRGTWPHIRSNWVTRNNEILQVAGRSAQPWIDSNAALFRILGSTDARPPRLLSYRWDPATIATLARPPQVENYLVAIAEAGAFGGHLLLPLDEDLQTGLLLGLPSARADWARIRQHLEFYAWDLPMRYTAVASIGVVTADPMASIAILNLLARHNLPFELIDPSQASAADVSSLDLLLFLEPPTGAAADRLMDVARRGGTAMVIDPRDQASPAEHGRPWRAGVRVETSDGHMSFEVGAGRVIEVSQPVTNPDTFALGIRQILGRDRRVLDIWNGITVLATSYTVAAGDTVMVTALNYAHQPLPVQLRIRGTFSVVEHESPEDPPSLLTHAHRDGFTEFVLPALRTGARVFLRGRTDARD
jgi:hypothetical protein